MTVDFQTVDEARCSGRCWKGASWRSVLSVPCCLMFAVALLVPGLTLTIVPGKNNDSSGVLVRYGALHLVGIVLLVISGLLLFLVLLLGCCCRESSSQVSPDPEDGGSLDSNSLNDPEFTGRTHSTHEAKIPVSNGVLLTNEPKSKISGHFVNHMIPEDDEKEPSAEPPVENPESTSHNDSSSNNNNKDQAEISKRQPQLQENLATARVKAAGPQRKERWKGVARSGRVRGDVLVRDSNLKETPTGAEAHPTGERETRDVRAALIESARSFIKQAVADRNPRPKNVCNFMEADSDEEEDLAAKYAAAAEAFPRDRNGVIRNMSTLTSSESEDSAADDDDFENDISEESAVGRWDDETSGSVFESPEHQTPVRATIHEEQTGSGEKAKFRAKYIQGQLDEEINPPSRSPINKFSSRERSSSQGSQPSPSRPALATVHEEGADPYPSAANRIFVARTTLRRVPAEDPEGSFPLSALESQRKKKSRKQKKQKDRGRQPQSRGIDAVEAGYNNSGYVQKAEPVSSTGSPSYGTSSLRSIGSEGQSGPELGGGLADGELWAEPASGLESSPERAVLYAGTSREALSRSPVPLPAWPSSCYDPRHVTVLGATRGSVSSASREVPSSPPSSSSPPPPPPPELALPDPGEMRDHAEKRSPADKEDATGECLTENQKAKKKKKKKKKREKERRRRKKSTTSPDKPSAASTDAAGLRESRQGGMDQLPGQPETETHAEKSESSPPSSVVRLLKPIVHDPQHHTDHHVHWPDTPLSPPVTGS